MIGYIRFTAYIKHKDIGIYLNQTYLDNTIKSCDFYLRYKFTNHFGICLLIANPQLLKVFNTMVVKKIIYYIVQNVLLSEGQNTHTFSEPHYLMIFWKSISKQFY